MPSFELRYPSDVSFTASYVPSVQPDVDGADGPDPGIVQEKLGDGSVRSKRQHADVKRYRRPFDFLTAADETARAAFFAAVDGGRQFSFRDEIQTAWVTVMFTGESLQPLRRSYRGAGYFQCVEELVEVPTPSVDALGAIRKGRLTITGSATEGAILFSSAFNNLTYNFTYGVSASSANVPMLMVREKAGRTQSGLTMELSGSPGAGNSIFIDYLAVE